MRPFGRERRLEGGLEQRLFILRLTIYLPTRTFEARCEPNLKSFLEPFTSSEHFLCHPHHQHSILKCYSTNGEYSGALSLAYVCWQHPSALYY